MDQLQDKEIEEFREAYKKEFNEEIPITDARIMLWRLVEFYRAIAKPLPGQRKDENKNS